MSPKGFCIFLNFMAVTIIVPVVGEDDFLVALKLGCFYIICSH